MNGELKRILGHQYAPNDEELDNLYDIIQCCKQYLNKGDYGIAAIKLFSYGVIVGKRTERLKKKA